MTAIPAPNLNLKGGDAGPSSAASGLGAVRFGDVKGGINIFALGGFLIIGFILWKKLK